MEHSLSGVGVIDKSMAVLEVVAARPCTLSEIATATGLPKATAHRLASALEAHGLLRRHDDGFALGLRLRALGRRAEDGWPLAQIAEPVLAWLRDQTGESVQLFVPSGRRRLCLASLESAEELRTTVEQGALLPMELGSAGQALTWAASAGPAAVTATTPRRVFTSVGERAPGVASVSAAAVVDGEVVAISVSGPIGRTTRHPGTRYGPAVAEAAGRLEARAHPEGATMPDDRGSVGTSLGPA